MPTCLQCGVELCDSVNCVKFSYEDFVRQQTDLGDDGDKVKDGAGEPIDEEEEKRLRKEEKKKQIITSMKGTALKMKQDKKQQQQSSKRSTVKIIWIMYSNFLFSISLLLKYFNFIAFFSVDDSLCPISLHCTLNDNIFMKRIQTISSLCFQMFIICS